MKDKIKQRALKYIMFKKRTEREVRAKLRNILAKTDCSELNSLNELENSLIEELKEQGYIDDQRYIERSISEFINLKTLSIEEIKNKLLQKGLDKQLIEEYIDSNKEKLKEYELHSAKKIWQKKSKTMDPAEIKQYLMRKGYEEHEHTNIRNEEIWN